MSKLLNIPFGFAKKRASHSNKEVIAVSVSCCECDRMHSYSFSIRKDGEKWLFYADCFLEGLDIEASIRAVELTSNDVSELFELLTKNNCTMLVKSRKKPFRPVVSDGSSYCLHMTFQDGKQCAAKIRQISLEQYFHRIAYKISIEADEKI